MTDFRNEDYDDSEAESEDEEKKTRKPQVFRQKYTSEKIHYYLTHAIKAPTDYVEMCHTITHAHPSDHIILHLNLPGGRVDTGVMIISAMQNSQAHITAILEGEVCSMGSLIFLAADEFVVNKYSLLMIHNFSQGIEGKGHEIKQQYEGTQQWFEEIAQDLYLPFLTKAELKKVFNGTDIWLTANEINRRLKRVIKKP